MKNKLLILLGILFFCGNITIVSAQISPEEFLTRGLEFLKKGECKKAKTEFERAKVLDPKNSRIDGFLKQADDCLKKPKQESKSSITTNPVKQIKLLFDTDYPCDLYIDGKYVETLKKNQEKAINLVHKDTFHIVASSPENIEYECKIAAADVKKEEVIQIKLKDLIPKEIKDIKLSEVIIIQVNPSKLHFGHSGGKTRIDVDVNTGIPWDTLRFPAFCRIKSKYPSFFEIECDTNSNVEHRETWFIIKAGFKEVRIDVEQDAAPIELDAPFKNVFVEDVGETKMVSIKTNFKDWEVKMDSTAWIKVLKNNSDSLKIECTNNPSVSTRNASCNIIAGDQEITITVEQKGKPKTLTVYPKEVVFKPKGGTQFIGVQTTTGEYAINVYAPVKWHDTKKVDTGFTIHCNPYKKNDLRIQRENLTNRKNLTRCDTVYVNVKEISERIIVKQKAPPLALKIPHNTFGLSIGYVQKNWTYQIPKDTAAPYHIVWENTGKMLGIQAGVRLDFYFKSTFFGLGISTGPYYQFMYSKTPFIQDSLRGNYKKTMQEHSIYLPIHLIYRYDITKKIGIFINGGIGIDWSMYLFVRATDKDAAEPFYVSSNIYKNIDWKLRNRFVLTGEYGGGVRFERSVFTISFSQPLRKQTSNTDTFPIIPNSRVRIAFILMLG